MLGAGVSWLCCLMCVGVVVFSCCVVGVVVHLVSCVVSAFLLGCG